MQEQIIPTNPEDAEAMVPVIPETDVIQGINATIQIGEVTTLPPGSQATVRNSGTPTHAKLDFGIPEGEQGNKGDKGDTGATGATGPQGPKGEKGDTGATGPRGPQGATGPTGPQGPQGIQGVQGVPGKDFSIYKTYASVAEMNADAANVPEGEFVMIASTTQDPDNAKLYVKNGEGTFTYLSDLSGAQGIQGPQGEQGIQGLQGIPGPQGETGPRGSVKSQYVAELPASGDEDTFYLVDRDLESHTATGKFITFETSKTAAELQATRPFYGNATQTTYSGKNLFDYPSRVATQGGGLTWSLGDDGYFTISGTLTTSYTNIVSAYDITDMLVDGQTYTVSTSGTGNQYAYTMLATTNIGTGTAQYHGTSTSPYTFTVDKSTYTYRLNAQTATTATWGSTSRSLKVGFQLEKGSTATDFQKYVGGTPAPNPEFPQPISVVTGENVVKVVGKNLWDSQTAVEYSANSTVFITDGWLQFGTGGRRLSYPLNVPVGTSVILTATIRSLVTTQNVVGFEFLYEDGTTAALGTAQVLTDTDEHDFIASGTTTKKVVCIRSRYTSARDAQLKLDTIQLELGSTATAYEPYQGQDFEVNLGKNLLQYASRGASNGITTTQGADGTLTATGTATSTYADMSATITERFPAGTYTFSCTTSTGLNGARIALRFTHADNTTSTFDIPATADPVTVNLTKDATKYYYFLRTTSGTDYDLSLKLQLEAGSKATSFAPYFTPLELAKIGTYQDRIYKEGEKWYIEKQVGKVVLTGSADESWGYNGNDGVFVISNLVDYLGTGFVPISDYYTGQNISGYSQLQNMHISFLRSSTSNRTVVKNTNYTSAADFKTWLQSHNTTVYYALATPTTTEITDQTLVDQLEALASAALNQGVNNIFTEIATGNAMPTLELNWVEWQKYNRHNVYIWNDDIDDWQVIVGAGA